MRPNLTLSILAASLALTTAAYAQGDGATHGKEIFDAKCALCHNADSTDKKIGPGLKGLYAHGTFADGTTKVTDASVTDRIETGKVPMPPFKGQLSDAEIKDVVSYLKTL